MLEKVTLPSYTKGEEIFNGISHGIGILFAIFATVFYQLTLMNHMNLQVH